jgi:beta-glucanase (GH16 family)
MVSLGATTAGSLIYYTVDGSAPTTNSTRYTSPFLVASNLTVQAIAQAPSYSASNVASQTFNLNIPPGTLVWSDEFSNSTGANAQANPAIWMYLTGGDSNSSVDIHCAYGSTTTPCSTAYPNSFVGTDGYLHILAQQPSAGVYTSARLETQGLFSFQYGRLEARIWVPEGPGIWPAFWLEGNNAATVGWPGCGEMDVMERINAAGLPPVGTQSNPAMGTTDWNEGSIHGTGFTGGNLGGTYDFTGGQTAAGWHTYGMIKTASSIAYYVDDSTHPYVTFMPSSIAGLPGSVWPFDNGQGNYLILNIAVGGSWPGAPNASTVFPSEMLVDYVRVYTN